VISSLVALVLVSPAAPPPEPLAVRLTDAQRTLRDALLQYWERDAKPANPERSGELVLTLYGLSLDWQEQEGPEFRTRLPVPLHPKYAERLAATIDHIRNQKPENQQSYHVALDVLFTTQLIPAAEAVPEQHPVRKLGIPAKLRLLWEEAYHALRFFHASGTENPRVVRCRYTKAAGFQNDPSQLQFLALAYHATWQLRRMGYALGKEKPLPPPWEDDPSRAFWSDVRGHLRARLGTWDFSTTNPDASTVLNVLGPDYGKGAMFPLAVAGLATYVLASWHQGYTDESIRCPCTRGPLTPDPARELPGLLVPGVQWAANEVQKLPALDAVPTNFTRAYALYAFERLALALNLTVVSVPGPDGPTDIDWFTRAAEGLLPTVKPTATALTTALGAGKVAEAQGHVPAAGLAYLFLVRARNDRLAWIQLSTRPDGTHFHSFALAEAIAVREAHKPRGLASEPAPLLHALGRDRLRKSPILCLTEGIFPTDCLERPEVIRAIRDHLADGGCLVIENAGRAVRTAGGPDAGEAGAKRFREQLDDWLERHLNTRLAALPEGKLPEGAFDPRSLVPRNDPKLSGLVALGRTHGTVPNVVYFDTPLTCALDSLCAGARHPSWNPTNERQAVLRVWEALADWRTCEDRLPWAGWTEPAPVPAPDRKHTLRVGWLTIGGAVKDWQSVLPEPVARPRDGEPLPATARRFEALFAPSLDKAQRATSLVPAGEGLAVDARLVRVGEGAQPTGLPLDLLWVCLERVARKGEWDLAEALRPAARQALLGGSVIIEWFGAATGKEGNKVPADLERAWKAALAAEGKALNPARIATPTPPTRIEGDRLFGAEIVSVGVALERSGRAAGTAVVVFVSGGPSAVLARSPDKGLWSALAARGEKADPHGTSEPESYEPVVARARAECRRLIHAAVRGQ
jgi:hypothetical protein